MTVEIISWSISTKVWDRVGIQSRDPWIQTHICCQTRYRLRKRSYWIQPNLFGDLLAQVGEQEHYCFLLFGSPLHGPQRVCIFWLNCSLFLNCWLELNQICAQLKQIVYTRAYFWVPHSEAPYNGVKSVCPFFFYANPNMLCWIQPNLLKGLLSHNRGVVKNIYFFNLPAKFSIIRNYWVIRRLRTVPTFSLLSIAIKLPIIRISIIRKIQFFEVICGSRLKKWLLNYLSRFEVQMSRMVIMISMFGRVYFYYID